MSKIKNLLCPNSQVLFSTMSPISGTIEVVQKGKERRLVVGGFVQSINWDCPGAEHRVWGQMAKIALEGCPNAQKILLLGLGAGTVMGLLKKEKPPLKITAIEMDKKIIEIAYSYFGLSAFEDVEIIRKDAFNAIKNQKADVVLVDVYCGGNFPEKFWSLEFFSFVRDALNNKGCAIFNKILCVDTDKEIKHSKDYLLKVFGTVGVYKVNVVGNRGNILFLCKE